MGDSYLLPQHYAKLKSSCIDEKYIVSRGYRSCEDPEELKRLGFADHQIRLPCLVIPQYNINGDLVSHCIRPDEPRLNREGKIIKYDRPPGTKNFLSFNPGMPAGWLIDPLKPFLWTEGDLKADSALSEGHACGSLMGVWGFRTKINGSSIIVPDFRLLRLSNKVVHIGFDSDAITKLPVYQAQVELGALLESLYDGVMVGYFYYDPPPPEGVKWGIDDWRAEGKTIQQLMDTALPIPYQPADLDQRHDKFDFYAYGEAGKYIYVPTKKLWGGESVDSQVPPVKVPGGEVKPTKWLSQHRNVHQMTWAPGEPQIIKGKLATGGGWVEKDDARLFNVYSAPMVGNGDAAMAKQWLDHVERLYPNDVTHIVNWFAHRVQYPGVKINHALLFGGMQGVGKDTIVEPLITAIGSDNFKEATPARLGDAFRPFLKAVVLRISELRDMGDQNRYGFYEHMKMYTAAPPHFIEVNEKYQPEITIPNIMGIIYTTNSRTDGLYLPVDDRRHYVMWTDVTKESYGTPDELAAYFKWMHDWYDDGGAEHVAAYLRNWDLSGFDAKASPPKTDAWWQVVTANMSSESGEIAFLLEEMGKPIVVTMEMVIAISRKGSIEDSLRGGDGSLEEWAADRKNWKAIPRRMEDAGYVRMVNKNATDGRWTLRGKKVHVFARLDASERDRMTALTRLLEPAA